MQTAYLFPGTVAENVAYGRRQRGQRLLAQQTDALLQCVGLSGYQERNANNLSGGEAQRVSIARTLANAPEILLLDEPTSALDEDSARGVEGLVLNIIRERCMQARGFSSAAQLTLRTAEPDKFATPQA